MSKRVKWLYLFNLLFFLVACSQQPTAPVRGPELPDETLSGNVLDLLSPKPMEVLAVAASAHDGNSPENTLDKEFVTKWSALGDGQWIKYDLGTVQPVGAVNIAFDRGDEQISYFDIEISSSGSTWALIYSGESSGVSKDLESFDIPDTFARYLRIVGHGNSNDDWNSFTEVAIQGGSGFPVLAVTTSAQGGNGPDKTRDGNLATRWSAFGDGQWISYDLGEARSVSAVEIAFHRGDRRVVDFDVETSLDGSSWVSVLAGKSSGVTKALETFTFAETDARYLRIVGHGNSENGWNSLTEVEIHGGNAPPQAGATRLMAQHSGKCMDVDQSRLPPETEIVQSSCSGSDDQLFTFLPLEEVWGAFTIRSLPSDLCFEVSADRAYNGQPILTQNVCSGNDHQVFTLNPSGPIADKVFQVIAKHSGECIGVANASLEDQARLTEDSCNTHTSQQWYIADFAADLPTTPQPTPPQPTPQPTTPQPVPQGNNEVSPVRWSSFTNGQPGDAAALNLRTATLNANKYLLTTWWTEVKDFDAQSGTHLDFGGRGEHEIRHPAAAAVSLAISLKTGIYDASDTGVGVTTAKGKTLALIRSLAYRHRATTTPGWGTEWQSALWAHKVGLAAWLMWDDLSSTEQDQVRSMLEVEADRLIGYTVPYYRNADGELIKPGDTKAEENAWNASLLHLTAAMMPEHPHRHAWTYKNLELKASSYAQPSDLGVDTLLHGRPLKDWLYGSNAYDDGVVINHGRVHPDYMAAIEHNLEGAIVSSLARQPTPAAALVNAEATYEALVDRHFAEGSRYPDTTAAAKPPGGTMYVGGSGDLYYPQGNDWGTDRVIPYVLLDALAAAFDFDDAASRSAEYWATLHTAKLLEQQARHGDGRTYATAKEDRYFGREEYVGEFAALAYLSRWLVHQHAFSIANDAHTIVVDNLDREFSVQSGDWSLDRTRPGSLGSTLHIPGGDGSAAVRYTPRLPETAMYSVYAWWSCGAAQASDASYAVHHAAGTTTVHLDQRTDCGQWNPIGVFSFTRGGGYVEQTDDADGRVVADAVMFSR